MTVPRAAAAAAPPASNAVFSPVDILLPASTPADSAPGDIKFEILFDMPVAFGTICTYA